MVRLDDAHDIDDPNREDLIYFVNRHFVAEMPRFEGEEYQNVFQEDGSTAFTDEYKRKAVEVVRMNNTHKCSTAINGCKKDGSEKCKRGYSRTELISETIVNEVTNRIVYRRRMECDLKIVPYNLQMIMDWDSHLNIEYSGSAYLLNQSRYLLKDISATSTTQSSSPQHPMRKIGNRRHDPSLLNPHSPLRLDLLKDKSLP